MYKRFLIVARWLYVPTLALIALIFLLGFATVLGGARHASDGAIARALFGLLGASIVAALLPLLLFIPDRGAGSAVRWLHRLGATCLGIALCAIGYQSWQVFGEPAFQNWRVARAAANLELTGVTVEPIRIGETLIGARVHSDFRLAKDLALDRIGTSVLQAMREARLEVVDSVPHVTHALSYYGSHVSLTRDGVPVSGETLRSGLYRDTQTLWLAGLSLIDGDVQPCKMPSLFEQPHVQQTIRAASGAQWAVQASVFGSDASVFSGSRKTVWQTRSKPVDLRVDGQAWIDAYPSLPLPTCAEREAQRKVEKEMKRLADYEAGTLPSDQAFVVFVSVMCSGDLDKFRALVAHGVPDVPFFSEAMGCARQTRQPEILALLGSRLLAHETDRRNHCEMLETLHQSQDAEQLEAIAKAGLPLTCDAIRPRVWERGIHSRAPGGETAEELTKELRWLRLLNVHKVPLCTPGTQGVDRLRAMVTAASAPIVLAWLDAGCDPAARPDPATVEKFSWSNYSPRMMWMLRRFQAGMRPWPPPATDKSLDAEITRRMGEPDREELNAVFGKRGGMTPLHDFARDVLASPDLLRHVVDRGARLDAASHATHEEEGPLGPYRIEAGSWYFPGYRAGGVPNVDVNGALSRLTVPELKILVSPVDLTTGAPAARMTMLDSDSPYELRAYLCARKVSTCPTSGARTN